MKNLTLRLALLGLALSAVAVLAACGSSSTSSSGSAATKANGVDRAFLAGMLPHHRSAVAMARVAQQEGTSPFVKGLANNIVRTQTSEISFMQTADARLAKAGIKPGDLGVPMHMMGMMENGATELRGAKPFDAKFMKMMVTHHTGAVVMAKAELARGGDARLKGLARSIIAAQQREIKQMDSRLGSDAPSAMPMGSHH